jgi:uncharacterized protein YkwD
MLALINQARSDAGLSALAIDDDLRDAALGHSTDMAATGNFSHTGSDGSDFLQRIQATGYNPTTLMPFELIASQSGSTPAPAAILNLFLSDPAHAAPILSPTVVDLGIGYSVGLGNGGAGTAQYWTLLVNPFDPNAGGNSGGASGTTDGGGGGGATAPISIDASACGSAVGQTTRALCLINDVRARSGVAALAVESHLVTAADGHTLDLRDGGASVHTGSDGSTFDQRIVAAGYTGIPVSELIGFGFPTADDLVQAYLDDQQHRDILLSPDTDEIGISERDGTPDSIWPSYWTLDFGRAASTTVAVMEPSRPAATALLACLGLVALRRRRRRIGRVRVRIG